MAANALAKREMQNRTKPAIIRCAIYTRKSTEEGLEQDFNTLDAQREAAESFIRSQKQEGWIAVEKLYYRHFRRRDFTELVVAHEVEDVDAITTEEKERHGIILDQFILAYRAFTSDVAVRIPNDLVGESPLIRFGVHQYTDEELRRPEHERVTELRDVGVRIEGVPLGAHPHALAPPPIDPEKVCPIISAFLASGEAVPAPQTILIQALEALKISQDYRHALLLAFFSIEQVVTETLEDIKKKAGIPEKTIKNFRAGEFGISYRINIELPLVFPPESIVRKLIPDLDRANG